jgi:hypothetical protein
MPNVVRCKHGVILPHECRECEAEIPAAEVKAFAAKMEREAKERAADKPHSYERDNEDTGDCAECGRGIADHIHADQPADDPAVVCEGIIGSDGKLKMSERCVADPGCGDLIEEVEAHGGRIVKLYSQDTVAVLRRKLADAIGMNERLLGERDAAWKEGKRAQEAEKSLAARVSELDRRDGLSQSVLASMDVQRHQAQVDRDRALTELAAERKERNIFEAERDRLKSLVADQRIAIQGYADQRDAAKSEAMEERNHREKGESVMRELTKQRDALRRSSRSPFTMGELHGGSEGMTCDHQACQAKSWTVFLTAAEWRDVWQHRDTDAGLFINQKKLGKVLCEKHAAEVAIQSQVLMPVLAEISRALTKFPTWPTDPLHAMAVLGEEYGELNKAILQEVYEPHKQDRAAVRTEAVQCAAMALRFLTSIDAYRFDRCEQHRQEASI